MSEEEGYEEAKEYIEKTKKEKKAAEKGFTDKYPKKFQVIALTMKYNGTRWEVKLETVKEKTVKEKVSFVDMISSGADVLSSALFRSTGKIRMSSEHLSKRSFRVIVRPDILYIE